MPRPKLNLQGKKFNMLEVLSLAFMKRSSYWNCRCDCGNEKIIKGSKIINEEIKSCGCLLYTHNLSHGHSKRNFKNKSTKTYSVWLSMRGRCFNESLSEYKYYGGRGIKVCKRWEKFENFLEDMGERPEGLSIDRIDNNLGYSKENCRWANSKTQSRNRRGKENSASKVKGVVPFGNKWRARITLNKKLTCLGIFATKKEAAVAYNKSAKKNWGHDAYVNRTDSL